MGVEHELRFEDYTIAWIAPLEIEAQAAWYMLDREHRGSFTTHRGDDYVYTPGEINGHNVVIATFPTGHTYGVGSAAALASQVKKSFPNLWFGLLVGVAAGLPDLSRDRLRDIRLGDVLVGVGDGDTAGLVSYGLGKETSDGFKLLQGTQAKSETVVRSAIGKIKTYAPMHKNAFLEYYRKMRDQEHTTGTFADPGQEKDKLYDASGTRLVKRSLRHVAERTRVWYGPIGSGDRLMKNAHERDKLRDTFNLIGLEMEAAGTMDAIPVGVIRGVCDYGDAQKNKIWQPYAAAMAAAYAKAVLYHITPAKNQAKPPSYNIPSSRNAYLDNEKESPRLPRELTCLPLAIVQPMKEQTSTFARIGASQVQRQMGEETWKVVRERERAFEKGERKERKDEIRERKDERRESKETRKEEMREKKDMKREEMRERKEIKKEEKREKKEEIRDKKEMKRNEERERKEMKR
jgi:nucleoside phosphorylase